MAPFSASFSTLLVANRGEIACRVIRSAKALGYATVAVYSDADSDARHVHLADEAVRLGYAPVGDSYLSIERVMAAVAVSGADAVHPGYGFLAENAAFAEACAQAGVVFIGPSVDAITLMGSKRLSKGAMQAAGVACIPGYAASQDNDDLVIAARDLGFPVMIKASAGGGGRGMRLVNGEDELAAQLGSARSEAANAFGDGELILEKALVEPRHIEIQIMADSHGNVIHLGERDCSIQRRHQKVVEESPSPFVDDELREKMGAAAVDAARACDYVGAGTVEFLVDGGRNFYFLEMNTRLQVEHPVTELVTGLDLVALQINVAAGEALPLSQEQVQFLGHAVEVRLYAEDPASEFLPQTGVVHLWREPMGEGVRVDHGIRQGGAVTPYYDPMLGKVIAHGESREVACRRLRRALEDLRLLGVTTNQGFLSDVVSRDTFLRGAATTAFMAKEYPEGFGSICDRLENPALYLAMGAALLHRDEVRLSGEERCYGWSNGAGLESVYRLEVEGEVQTLYLRYDASAGRYQWRAQEGRSGEFGWEPLHDNASACLVKGRRIVLDHVLVGGALYLHTPMGPLVLSDVTRRPAQGRDEVGSGRIVASMDGAIIGVEVKVGQRVEKGDVVAVLEAMKMEHSLKADVDGLIESVTVVAGAQVKGKQLLVVISPESYS